VLPLRENEARFISMIRNVGTIDPSIITDDLALQEVVKCHPALQWAVQRGKSKQIG